MFPSTDLKNKQNDWTSYHGPSLYQIDILNNQQECYMLRNWFSWRLRGSSIDHLPSEWWSTVKFMFLDGITCVKFNIAERNFLVIISFYLCRIHYPNFTYDFTFQIILLKILYTKYFVLPYSVDLISSPAWYCCWYLFIICHCVTHFTITTSGMCGGQLLITTEGGFRWIPTKK